MGSMPAPPLSMALLSNRIPSTTCASSDSWFFFSLLPSCVKARTPDHGRESDSRPRTRMQSALRVCAFCVCYMCVLCLCALCVHVPTDAGEDALHGRRDLPLRRLVVQPYTTPSQPSHTASQRHHSPHRHTVFTHAFSQNEVFKTPNRFDISLTYFLE